jgi:hypothetical protein
MEYYASNGRKVSKKYNFAVRGINSGEPEINADILQTLGRAIMHLIAAEPRGGAGYEDCEILYQENHIIPGW